MQAHGALCRLAVSHPSARDLPQLARFLQRTLYSRRASTLPAVRAFSRAFTAAVEARRSYATTTSATKPTATVKKAVKAKAAEKAPPKKRTTKATAAKTAKKSKAAAKAKPKAAKPRKKAAPKKRVQKALTPEQEEKVKTRKEKAKITELRKTALKEPHSPTALSAYLVYVTEHTQGKSNETQSDVNNRVAELGRKWKTLTPAELEHYNHLAQEKNVVKAAEYRAWVQSHTPQEIRAANLARLHLRRLLKSNTKRGYPKHTKKIVDDRQVKRPTNAYNLFNTDRFSSGDFKNITVGQASKLISEEWKALSAGEKKKYLDEYEVSKEKYAREVAAIS